MSLRSRSNDSIPLPLPLGHVPARRLRLPGTLLALAALALPAAAQDASDPGCFLQRGTRAEAAERPSPLDSASIELGGDMAKICYGSPRARERVVMGGLVPWGQPWRTGANEATGLHVEFPAEIAGIPLEPGSYSLFTVPGEAEWQIVLTPDFERWGVPIDESVRAAVVGEATVAVEETGEHVENMTFRFEPVDAGSANLVFEWERTRLRIPLRRSGG